MVILTAIISRCRKEIQVLAPFHKKPEWSLSFSYENTVVEETNLRPVKAVHSDERVLSLAQIHNV